MKELTPEFYFKTINSDDFREFTVSVMEKYYGCEGDFLTKFNDNKIPVFCLPSSEKIKRHSQIEALNAICVLENQQFSDNDIFDVKDHQNYKKNKYYEEYKDIVGDSIRCPNRPVYMLDKIITKGDKELLIDKVGVRVGTFAENVFSSHILEYELFKSYNSFKKEWKNKKENNSLDESFWNKVIKSLEIRNKITSENKGKINSLLYGQGRASLLSFQMLVVIKSKSGDYEVKMIQRSKDVSITLGEFQFVPCGGFEVFNDSDDGCYYKTELDENLSPGCAVFREYLEEFFQGMNFEDEGIKSVLKDKRIKKISEMLVEEDENPKASLIFLGDLIDLRYLCHTLCFALIIRDDSYYENQFFGNNELRKGDVLSLSLEQLNNYVNRNKMNAISVAIWHMFTKTKEYDEIAKKGEKSNNDETGQITI